MRHLFIAACLLTKMDNRKEEEERVTEESSSRVGPSQFCFCKGKAGYLQVHLGQGAQPQVPKVDLAKK